MQLVNAILGYVSGQFTDPSRDREIDGGDAQPGGGWPSKPLHSTLARKSLSFRATGDAPWS
jgi:hypothetical protein